MNDRNYALLWANGTNFHDLMNLHAHDLAEKIRAHEDSTGCMDCPEETCYYFADLIDPWVEDE